MDLKNIIEMHTAWLNNEGGNRADLRSADLRSADFRDADLRSADLSGTNLSGADLSGADLRDANLRGADIDFSCIPLWCGGLNFTVDERIFRQLLYHTISIAISSGITSVVTPELIKEANKFHRVGEVPSL